MKLVLCLSLLAGATAFAPSRTSLNVQAKATARPITYLNVAAEPPTEVTRPPAKIPEMMDSGIYTFNKVLIDTVYNVICFFYPVTGEKRDFARFYVLETVARVPYFAYLSVMHLRYVAYSYPYPYP